MSRASEVAAAAMEARAAAAAAPGCWRRSGRRVLRGERGMAQTRRRHRPDVGAGCVGRAFSRAVSVETGSMSPAATGPLQRLARRWREPRFRCRHREPGAAAAASARSPASSRQPPRGAVMAGPEGEGGLHLDADLVDPHRGAVMRAVHHENRRAHGLQAIERGRDPVLRRDMLETRGPGEGLAAGGGDQTAPPPARRARPRRRPRRANASRRPIRRPRPHSRGVEHLAEPAGKRQRRLHVGRQPHHMRGSGGE